MMSLLSLHVREQGGSEGGGDSGRFRRRGRQTEGEASSLCHLAAPRPVPVPCFPGIGQQIRLSIVDQGSGTGCSEMDMAAAAHGSLRVLMQTAPILPSILP